MAGVPHSLGEERATVPRIVLPITSRGLELTDRLCWFALGAAMVAAAALILYLNRGTIFYADELAWVYLSPNLGPSDVLEPHNGHLIATTRLVYKAILETIGTEYVAFRVLAVGTLLLSAGLFYTLVKRRVGALPALAPTIVLLFLGSAWGHVVIPIGLPIVLSVAAGLAALLALERGDRRGDVGGCALLILSVVSYTSGLAFVAGAALSVLLRPDRRGRAWIFLVPLALYATWFVWSLSSAASPESEGRVSNVLVIPSYVADSLGSVMAALTGLGFDFSEPLTVNRAWGQIIAVLAVGALALRVRRGAVPAMVWIGVAILLAYWALGALVAETETLQTPGEVRYIYVGAVGVLLVAAAAATRIRFSKLGLVALFAAAAVSLATNLAVLRDGAGAFRNDYSPKAGAQFAMLELARDQVDPGFDPEAALPDVSPVGANAAFYFSVVDEFGSPAFTLAQLEAQPEGIREFSDQVLASALALRLEGPSSSPPAEECVTLPAGPTRTIAFDVPSGGATLRVSGAGLAALTLGRFADVPSAEVGSLSPGGTAALRIPPDDSPTPWRATIAGAQSAIVCLLPSGASAAKDGALG